MKRVHLVEVLEEVTTQLVEIVWGLPLVVLLIGSGVFLALRIQFLPLLHLRHTFDLLRGRYDDPKDPGELSHFQALTSALSATLGLGNIAGVAIAVSVGGPGAIFWMWIAGLVGMATKFFTCTLACLYRVPNAEGVPQGGPMYFIEAGLGPRFKPLGIMFAACGMIGCLGIFQANQLAGLLDADYGVPRIATGSICVLGVGAVILGGISRVGKVSARVVPAMTLLYLGTAALVMFQNAAELPALLESIITHAFTGGAVLGGAAHVTVREVIVTGIRRAAFSNEAGIGTAALAHGAAKTKEPVREGLVAMIGPFIDTNVVCTMTACVILASGV
ncbi:MAG: sodium:alanine symporter family protein, partial [Akkermansiaceae bacterium]|nr:sodium:alanine symporter family protein [Akkermansiaceae bacterium]